MNEHPPDAHGYKWWLRYIVVPIIGGGGLVAIIVFSTVQLQVKI